MSQLLPGLVFVFCLVMLAGMTVMILSRPAAQAAGGVGTARAFGPRPRITLADSRQCSSVPPTTAEPASAPRPWQFRSLTNLRDVESFLDRLEVCGCAEREVVSLGTKSFAVRWR
ncbi:MAG: hypothetical protein ACRC7O_01150 [Fimbriiglobus sp.]